MGTLFSLSSYERKIDKCKKFLNYCSFKMALTVSFYYVFLYLACFIVSTYVTFIWVYWILMGFASSTTYLLRLQKKLSSCKPKGDWPHAGLYNIMAGKQNIFL